MFRSTISFCVSCVLSLFLCGFAVTTASHLKLSVKPQILTLKAGEQSKLSLTMSIDDGWHTYGLKPRKDKDGIGPQETEISLSAPSILRLSGKIIAPKPTQKFDEGFQITVDYYEKEAVFTLPVQAANTLKPGDYTVFVKVYYMICQDQRCLPPTDDSVAVTLRITEAAGVMSANQSSNIETPPQTMDSVSGTQTPVSAGRTQKPNVNTGTTTTESQQEINQKRSEGIWSFLWFAMGAGATALLTPCVFPMIPITVSFFTKRAEKKRSGGLKDSLVYALGIVLTFTALGFALSLIFGATGISDFAANPWVNLAIAALFVVLAFNLFGSFEIPLPTNFLNKLNTKSNEGEGILSVLLMGLTFSITSFTCTVPFVGAALVSASTGEWFHPIIGMAGFSLVFAAPFFLLALFPSALSRYPKAGGWMNNVKVVMGFLEIAAAMKFISNSDLVWAWGIMPREIFLAVWIGCGLMITMYILGVFRLSHDSPLQGIGAVRASIALMALSATVYLVTGLFGATLGEFDAFLPPKEYRQIINPSQSGMIGLQQQSSGQHSPEVWLSDYDEALREARRTGKAVFIDFTGFTCTNCRWMETNIFPLPEIQKQMNRMIQVRLYTDRREEPYLSHKKRQLAQFGSIELPLYVLLKPDGTVLATKTFTRNKEEFLNFLRMAQQQTSVLSSPVLQIPVF